MAVPTFRTYIAPSTQSLLRHLGHSSAISANNINMFALSTHADDLQAAVAHLTAIPNSIGTLTTSVFKGVQLSIVSYPKASCLPFRSTVPGVPQAQVGRIRTYRPPSREEQASETRLGNMLAEGSVDWNDALSESGPLELPSDLQRIRDKSSVSSFFYLSDGRPEGLFDSLHRHFPAASQLGLIGSSTPFITGRPFTLFEGTSVVSDGAVGVALFNHTTPSSDICFDGIYAVSEPMEVTQAQTNLVETLDDGNPAETLMAAMKAGGTIGKDQEIYLGVISDPTSGPKAQHSGIRTYNYSRIYRITAGGPSRGSLLLDATEGPQTGTKVQFATASPPQKASHGLNLSSPASPTVLLNVLDETQVQASSVDSDIRVLDKLFIGTSENGFVLKAPSKANQGRPWMCSVPGATVQWVW
ncbi:FIST N domain [Rhizoctonia solani]|uniref:FIST N domain n=1 Tax=Rhizoctonia solani TaxID=456999 RepID=A0A8H7H1K5_9AGAM|nr:FIST N domain [Rhizoctonia solani]